MTRLGDCWPGGQAVIATVQPATPELLGLTVRTLQRVGTPQENEHANVETPGGLSVPMKLAGTGEHWIIDLYEPHAFMAREKDGRRRPILLQRIVWPDAWLQPLGRPGTVGAATPDVPAAPRDEGAKP